MNTRPERERMSLPELELLYREQYGRFLRVAMGLVGDREAAHDAVQEAFARAIKNRSSIRSSEGVTNWLWRTLTNLCFDTQRRRARWSPQERADMATNGHAEEWPELRSAITELPERQRAVVFLRHYADLEYEAIGEILQISRGTVAATLHAAHTQLQRTLSEVTKE